ncbi:ABC transporter substrate-binding protein [Pseudonocardia sp. NPDC049635]|uniref:ABC transporter substrate-binding protein n=1 Tax=Pseudonocardia sp. NPDC049635 TaxID=3155506 RepID=UPI0033E6E9BC
MSADRPPRRRRLRTILAAAVAALTLAACGAEGPGEAAGADGTIDQLVVTTSSQTLDFAADTGVNGGINKAEVLVNTHGYLLQNANVPLESDPTAYRQDVFTFEGQLAESWEVSDDGLTYTFTLRDGILSHAGNELTADDVLWSYERKFATPTSTAISVLADIVTDPAEQFAKVDDRTFTITIPKASYGFDLLSILANSTAQIYDSTLLKQHATPEDPYAVTWSATNPQHGFGPYMVESVTPNEETVLVANPNWTLSELAVQRIVYRIVQDPATRANSVLLGDADIAEQLRPSDQQALAASEDVKLYTVDSNEMAIMPMVVNKAPFDNVLVRQAMAHAIPYDRIISDVYGGRATRRHSMLPENQPGYDGSGLSSYDHDPQRARELLAEAGHPDGVTFTLTIAAGIPDIEDTAVQIQTAAAEAGFTVEIETLPSPAFAEARANGTMQAFLQRDYSVVMAPLYQLSVWTQPDSRINWAKWEDPDYYAALDAATEIADPLSDEAGVRWNAAERVLTEQLPWVFVTGLQPSQAFSSSIAGYGWRSDNILSFRLMEPA